MGARGGVAVRRRTARAVKGRPSRSECRLGVGRSVGESRKRRQRRQSRVDEGRPNGAPTVRQPARHLAEARGRPLSARSDDAKGRAIIVSHPEIGYENYD